MQEITLDTGTSPIRLRSTGKMPGRSRLTLEHPARATPLPTRSQPNPAAKSARPSPALSAERNSDSQRASQPDRERASLEAVLRSAAAGDQQAWRELIETYSPRVFGLIRAQCNSTDLAEEITQSTFCTVVVKISGYTELGKFEQWLFRIAINRLRDEMRRRKRQARTVDDDALVGLIGPADERVAERHDAAQFAAMRDAVAQLSDADQHIIHLRHSAGLSFKQIAEILEQPLGTVLARHHRALKKLNEVLGGGCD